MTIQDTHGFISSRGRVRLNKPSSSLPMKLNVNITQRYWLLEVTTTPSSKTTPWSEFLGDEGIKHQYSAAYTPQQNGVAERNNHTLIDAARTMMAEFKSPYNFWVEAINTSCHATNRIYLRKILNKTPYEIVTEKKPNITYFRVFGCKCFILKKGACLSKFESKTNEGIFVGYASNSHAYRVYNKSSGLVEDLATWSLTNIMAPKWGKVMLMM